MLASLQGFFHLPISGRASGNAISSEAEFLTGSGTTNGYGVAVDSDGNVYKLLF
jgi:hypothetical protein